MYCIRKNDIYQAYGFFEKIHKYIIENKKK